MKRFMLLTAMLALTAIPALGADVKNFDTSWDAVKAKAIAEGKPIYLHFTTTWCGWCRKIEKETYTSEAGSKALEAFVPASLDCTVPKGEKPSKAAKFNMALMAKFGGRGYPFLVMVTPDQAVLNTVSGYLPPERFAAELEKALATGKDLKAVRAELAASGAKGYAVHLKAMNILSKVRLYAEAGEQAEKVRALDRDNAKGAAAEASLILLQATATAPADGDEAVAARKRKMEALAADIRKFDPDNDKGVLLKLLIGQVRQALGAASKHSSGTARAELLKTAEANLREIAKVAPKFQGRQMLWIGVAQVNARAGQRDAALAAFRKALDADPNSRVAPQLRKVIGQLDSAGKN